MGFTHVERMVQLQKWIGPSRRGACVRRGRTKTFSFGVGRADHKGEKGLITEAESRGRPGRREFLDGGRRTNKSSGASEQPIGRGQRESHWLLPTSQGRGLLSQGGSPGQADG